MNTAKETTPVVSANCDAEEVTLPPKLHKDRESPVKGRKFKELQQKISASAAAATISPSSVPTSDHQQLTNVDEKSSISVDAKKFKDTNSSNTTNLSQVILYK